MAGRALGAGLLAGVLALGVVGCSDEPPAPGHSIVQPGRPGEDNRTLSPEEAREAVPEVKPNEADAGYVRGMVVHHRQALEMTALVPERGRDEKVKGLASRIADTQRPEIGMLNRWLTRHGMPEVAPQDHGGHGDHAAMPGMATPEELAALAAASGADFDRRFLELMIRHHEGAITMATEVQRTGADIAVQEMADNIIAEQADEIARMRDLMG